MTRMWMVPPRKMCRQHLLGEHKEIHQLLGSIKKKYSIAGYIKNNCVEVLSIEKRHNELVEEMKRRGYNHKSPILSQEDINIMLDYLPEQHINYKVDVESSLKDILSRCEECCKLN